jgi:hypothetical protein
LNKRDTRIGKEVKINTPLNDSDFSEKVISDA